MARNKPRRSAPDPGDPVAQFLGVIADLLNEDQEMDPAQMKRALDEQIARNPLPPPVAGLSPERQARELVSRAWDSHGDPFPSALDALRLDPNCADAYVLLGTLAEDEPGLSFILYSLGMIAGSESLGEAFIDEHAGELYAFVHARPFLEAIEGAGHSALAAGAVEQAVTFFDSVLQLDSGDHLGVRYTILAIAMAHDDQELAATLFTRFPDEETVWTYWEALHAFRVHGDRPRARKLLGKALELNRHLPAFLQGRQPPAGREGDHEPGSPDEAAAAAWDIAPVWQATPGAAAWLAAGEEAARTGRRQWFIGLE
ncbi:MAG: hypothetical protein HUU14_03100 [Dehalococcoidia bacterium]|nr:MAG: hypothetical protein EDM76_07510 [bacterium]MCE7928534.1 hypothetical protein [Chloroflexi bacterium CFX7]MCK6563432.1 hypothetical protein [Dehalococcoidia bacterium]MCL4231669.1 hypothetical protein [Dehalococcoidia bacterium]NUQ54854.1 hypothetical protein [Dehalococcoidia bacterium]